MTGAAGAQPRGRLGGVTVAGVTAVISGISVFVNSYGVHALPSAPVYTTAKNLVAFALLAGAAGLARTRTASRSALGRWTSPVSGPGARSRPFSDLGPSGWLALAYVGIVGGGVAFVLFFEGLARTSATPAAVDRDTLVIWVALLAGPFLHERVNRWNLAAMALLVAGGAALALGGGPFRTRTGDLLVLAATLLWAIEVVVLRRLLATISPAAVSLVRMGVGSAALVVDLAVTGTLHHLVSLGGTQVGWVLLTGALLAAYVGTWTTALARARALDVTSVLVASALVTAVLQAMAGWQPVAGQVVGLVLVAAGTAVVVRRAPAWSPPGGSPLAAAEARSR